MNFTEHMTPEESRAWYVAVTDGKRAWVLSRMVQRLIGEAERRGQWQQFATAPRDATAILAWRKDAGVLAVKCHPPGHDPEIPEEDWLWFTLEGEDVTGDLPTLWMPFPEPSEAHIAAKGADET